MSTALSNPQKRYLRGLAHDLKPVVMVGAKGITANLVAELDSALEQHELVKVKVPNWSAASATPPCCTGAARTSPW
jgi:RNA-binding protein